VAVYVSCRLLVTYFTAAKAAGFVTAQQRVVIGSYLQPEQEIILYCRRFLSSYNLYFNFAASTV